MTLFFIMKYHYTPSNCQNVGAGEIYICDHPLFNKCTLYKNGNRGIIVVQEYYNPTTKARCWGPVTTILSYDIYQAPKFQDFFDENATEINENGLYPAFSVRKIMWSLRMKPLPKEIWECDIY